jgi:hypothetical protein
MKSHILIFSDYRGNERFYLRVRGTIPEVQLWLERCTISSRPDAEWASIRWQPVLSRIPTRAVIERETS